MSTDHAMSESSVEHHANAMPIDGQHHNDPPNGDKVLPTHLQHVTDTMLRPDYAPRNDKEEQEIAIVRDLQPARVVRVSQAITAQVRASLPENQMAVEMEEKDIPDGMSKRSVKAVVNAADEDKGWTKVTGKKTKKRYKSGAEAQANHPEVYTLPDSHFSEDNGEFEKEIKSPVPDYSAGLMVIDADRRLTKRQVVKHLQKQSIVPYDGLTWDTMITSLAKGGLLIKIEPEHAKKWEEIFQTLPGKIRCHPPTSTTRKPKNSVVIFGVDKKASLVEVRDGLRPVPCFVERFKRGNEPMNIVRVEYPTEEIASQVISLGWVKFNDTVWLSAEAPKPRSKTRFCRTCKRCKLDCTKKHCTNLRCGRCGKEHKTADCKVAEAEIKCLECDSSDHLMFKCPVMVQRLKAEVARKKATKKAKNKRRRERKKQEALAAKGNGPEPELAQMNAAKVVPEKSYAQAVAPTSQPVMAVEVRSTQAEELKQAVVMPSLFGISEDEVIRMTVESYVEVVLAGFSPAIQQGIAKNLSGKIRAVLRGSPQTEFSSANMEMKHPEPPVSTEVVSAPTQNQTESPAIELAVVSEVQEENAITVCEKSMNKPFPKKKYLQTKLINKPDKEDGMSLDRTRDITSWTDEHLNGSGLLKLANLTTPVSEGWTVVCGCGRLFNPKGRSGHMSKCPKAEYALVSSGDRKSTQKVLNSLW